MDPVSQPGDDASSERLVQLVLAHLDERLSDEEFAELQRQLQSDPAARAEYVKLARLDAELRDDLETPEGESNKVISMQTRTERPRLSPAARNLAIAAALALMALPAALLLRPGGDGEADGGTATVAGGEFAVATRGVAVITAQAGAVWDVDAESGRKRVLGEGVALEPGRLTLREGLAQIDFYGGASISLSGPAEIELVGSDSAVLHRGRVRADVPPAARGFEIRSGDVLIEDLGTSFGLAVGDDHEADVVVFDGEVRAIGRDGKPLSLFGGDAAHLKNGEASLQDAAAAGDFPGIADVVAGAGNRDESRYAAWQQSSRERRTDSRLVAYYDFEGLTAVSRRLENRATTASGLGSELDGGIVGARLAEGRWGQKTALDFRLEGDRVRFQIPGEFEALTLYAWVRIDALDRNLNSLFLTDYFDENEIHWQISQQGMLNFACSPMGAVDINQHNRRFFSEPFWDKSRSGQWFLLATTAESGGGKVIHYVNGEPVGISRGTQMDKPLPVMRIGEADLGNWSEPIWPDAAIRTLNGRIDEFAIFSQALSAEEIRIIYEQGKP